MLSRKEKKDRAGSTINGENPWRGVRWEGVHQVMWAVTQVGNKDKGRGDRSLLGKCPHRSVHDILVFHASESEFHPRKSPFLSSGSFWKKIFTVLEE